MLLPAAVVQALALIALVVVAHGHAVAIELVALAVAAGAMQPAIAPSVRALLGEMLTEPATRETAYSLESVIQELIWIVGPLVVAVVVTLVSPSGAVLVSAGVCVVGTTLFITSPRVRAGGGVALDRSPALGRRQPGAAGDALAGGDDGCRDRPDRRRHPVAGAARRITGQHRPAAGAVERRQPLRRSLVRRAWRGGSRCPTAIAGC